jgi:hypothetical protein
LLSFSVTDGNAASIALICQHLDGIPLAIKLAAARTVFMPVDAIAQRLDQRFRWLRSHSSGILPRQQTLRALIDWSYTLLNEQERNLFQRLSVFAGGWTLEAAEAICEEPDMCADILGRLVDQSLVVFGYDQERKRYRMHETIRQFAYEQLKIDRKDAEVFEKHARFFTRVVTLAVENQGKLTLISRLQQLQGEHDNLGIAFDWALKNDGELVLELVTNLGLELKFWELSGFFEEGRRWLKHVLETVCDANSSMRAKALLAAAELSSAISDFEYGISCSTQSQLIFNQLGDQRGEVDARLVFAELADFHGDYPNLVVFVQEAMKMASEIHYKNGLAKGSHLLGTSAFNIADYEQAIHHLLQCVALWRELDRQYELAAALNTLGASMVENQQYAAGSEVLLEVAKINQALGYRRGVALALHNIGSAAVKLNEYDRARELLSESLQIRHELGVRRGYAYSLEEFARLALAQNQDARAIQLLAAARALRVLIGAPLESSADREDFESMLSVFRANLGEVRFEIEWSKGFAMTAEQAVMLALS